MLERLFKNYKEIILYFFFGGCTSLVNILTYFLGTRVFHFSIIISTMTAWLLSIIFAYITNKKYVFKNEVYSFKRIIIEFITFVGCRLFTGIVDIGIMYLFVNIFNYNDLIIKILSNVIVIISNYIASKILVFKKHD